MSEFEDEDGIDAPFDRTMARAMAADASFDRVARSLARAISALSATETARDLFLAQRDEYRAMIASERNAAQAVMSERDALRESLRDVLEILRDDERDDERAASVLRFYAGELADAAEVAGMQCADCDGTGWTGVVRSTGSVSTTDPADVHDVECEACDGWGWVRPAEHPECNPADRCPVCEGAT